MKSTKEINALAQQLRVDMAMEVALSFPNYIKWQIFSPSGRVARSLSVEDRKAKYEAEFCAVLARVAEVNADAQEDETCDH
jgi:hypothetical protein